jgi:four helix bundle protein
MSAGAPRTHRDLIVWQRAVQFAAECYRLAAKLPAHQRFEIAAQLRTAAASVPANIAEGKGRLSRGDFARFLSYARGSAWEADSHLEIAVVTGLLSPDDAATARRLVDEVGRMLTAMLFRLRTSKQ